MNAQTFDGLKSSLPLRQFEVNSYFGYRIHPVTGIKNSFHSGIDLRAKCDTVFSILPGQVVKVSSDRVIGNYIVVHHGSFTSIYGHLSKSLVSVECLVGSASPLGISGATGRVTGEHLHFGVKLKSTFIDPLRFLYLLSGLNGQELFFFLRDRTDGENRLIR